MELDAADIYIKEESETIPKTMLRRHRHPRTEGTSGQPKEYDDLVTIELAYRLKCLLLDNDNYKQYLELGGENRLACESESKRNH